MGQNRVRIEADIRRHYWLKWLITIALISILLGLYWLWSSGQQGRNVFGVIEANSGVVEAEPAAIDEKATTAKMADETIDLTNGVPSNLQMGFTAASGTVIDLVLDGQRLGRAQVGDDGVWVWSGSDGTFAASPGNRGQLPSTFNWENIQDGRISADTILKLNGISIPNGNIVISVGSEQLVNIPIGPDGRWVFQGRLPEELEPGDYVLVGNVFDASGIVSLDDLHALSFTLLAPDEAVVEPPPSAVPGTVEPSTVAPGQEPDTSSESTEEAQPDNSMSEPVITTGILDVAAQMGSLEILAESVRLTGFDSTLNDGGVYTIFAFTDNAFASLPESVASAFLANAEAITQLVQHHVVAGEVNSADLITGDQKLTTVGGTEINVTVDNGAVSIEGAGLLSVDNAASNGIIHIVDSVLIPPSNIIKPEIDGSGAAEFQGDLLTIIGTGEPNSTLIVELSGNAFGQTFIDDDGSWLVAASVTAGEYEIVAYSLTGALEFAISDAVALTVTE